MLLQTLSCHVKVYKSYLITLIIYQSNNRFNYIKVPFIIKVVFIIISNISQLHNVLYKYPMLYPLL